MSKAGPELLVIARQRCGQGRGGDLLGTETMVAAFEETGHIRRWAFRATIPISGGRRGLGGIHAVSTTGSIMSL